MQDASEPLAKLTEEDTKAINAIVQQRALAAQRARGAKSSTRDREGGVRIKQKELDV